MYTDDIEIGGSRTEDDQFYRIPRLHRVIGYAQALADFDRNENFIQKVNSIYDHKGMVVIHWKTVPTENEKQYFQTAWESIVTDYESCLIEHIVEN